jgi:hypothetical protein
MSPNTTQGLERGRFEKAYVKNEGTSTQDRGKWLSSCTVTGAEFLGSLIAVTFSEKNHSIELVISSLPRPFMRPADQNVPVFYQITVHII